MRHIRALLDKPLLVFTSILIFGVLVVTVGYKHAQLTQPNLPLPEEFNDRHKLLLSAHGDMSKWLLGLASGALAAFVGLRLRDPANETLVSRPLMAAYSFLLLSLYGAFLSYDASLNVLRTGPLSYLYGDQMKFPVLVQFWSLIAALVILGAWLLRPPPKMVVLIMASLALASLPARAADSDRRSCVREWYGDRLSATGTSPDLALQVVKQLEKKPGAKPVVSCEEASSVLDSLRFSAVQSGKPDNQKGFDSYLASLKEELSYPGLGDSDVVHSIIELMSPWDAQAAVLSVRASKGEYHILLDGKEVGLTNWTIRLAPKTYNIRVVQNFKSAYSCDLTLAPSEQRLIDMDRLP